MSATHVFQETRSCEMAGALVRDLLEMLCLARKHQIELVVECSALGWNRHLVTWDCGLPMCRRAASRDASRLEDLPRCEAIERAYPSDDPSARAQGHREYRVQAGQLLRASQECDANGFGFGPDRFSMMTVEQDYKHA